MQAYDQVTPPVASEDIILQSRGYLANLLQKGVSARSLTVTLYATHLKIEDAGTSRLIEDVPLHQIKLKTRYVSSEFLWSLYTLFFSSLFILKTPKGHYRISWVDRDVESFMIGADLVTYAVARQNYALNMQWVSTIRRLLNGEVVPRAGLVNATGVLADFSSHFSSRNKPLGYFLIIFPVLVVLGCAGLFLYSRVSNSHDGLGFLGLVVGALLGLPMLALGLVFGLRKIH